MTDPEERDAAAAFLGAADAMLVVRGCGRIALANERAVELFGYSREELSNRKVEDLLPEALRAKHVEHRAAYGRKPQVRTMGRRAFNARRKDGTLIPVNIRLAPMEHDGADAVTTRIRDLRESRDQELGSLMRQRLSATDMLAAALLHELSNPLAIVLANLELAELRLKNLDFDEVRGPVCKAMEAASLITDLLHELRGLPFGSPLDTTPVDPVEVLEKAIRLGGPEVSTRMPIERQLDSRAEVMANQFLLAQVFVNLLENAREAMESVPCPDRRIALRSEVTENCVRVEVGDRGTGVSPQDLARIFDLHFSTKAGSYRGVGLALSRHVVERSGGSLTVVDRPGWATTFRVELPKRG